MGHPRVAATVCLAWLLCLVAHVRVAGHTTWEHATRSSAPGGKSSPFSSLGHVRHAGGGVHVGGDVYVYDLLPARGPALGGSHITFYGSGLTRTMACQFGRLTVPALMVTEEGDMLTCITPPFASMAGGFTAVGITITQTRHGSEGRRAGGIGARPVVTPRAAQSFEYVPSWRPRSARPSEVDFNGGAVVTVLGADLHATGSCTFRPAPVRHTAVHVVSSAVVRCEVPRREPGDGSLWLSAATPEELAANDAREAAASSHEGVPAAPDAHGAGGSVGAGLVLVARRPAVVSHVEASMTMAGTLVTVWGGGFVHARDPPGGASGGSGGTRRTSGGDDMGESGASDDTTSVAPPPHNGPGCRVGATWVAAAAVSRRHVACVAPWRAASSAAVPVAFHDVRDPATGSPPDRSTPFIVALNRGGSSRGPAAPHGVEVIPSVAPVEGGADVAVFGQLGAPGANAMPPGAPVFSCAASTVSSEPLSRREAGGGGALGLGLGMHRGFVTKSGSGSSLSCVAAPRPAGFVAVPQAADGSLLGLAAAVESAGPAFVYVVRPTVVATHPREGSGLGGEPSHVSGADLHVAHDGEPTRCAWTSAEGGRLVVIARVVSSALATCERLPSSQSHPNGGVLTLHAVGVEVGATAIGWSTGNRAFSAWPAALAVMSVEPRAVASEGGTAITLRGRGFPSSSLAAVCRVGTVGPIVASRLAPDALECVSPARAPGSVAVVTGPIAETASEGEASRSSHAVRVLRGGAAAVAAPGVLPARGATAGAADGNTLSGNNPGEETSTSTSSSSPATHRGGTSLLPTAPVALPEWLNSGGFFRSNVWCVFDASAGGLGTTASSEGSRWGYRLTCAAPLSPAGFAAAYAVADGGAEVLAAVQLEFRHNPEVHRAAAGSLAFSNGGLEGAVVDASGVGFFDGLSCAWNGAATGRAHVVSSALARCEQPSAARVLGSNPGGGGGGSSPSPGGGIFCSVAAAVVGLVAGGTDVGAASVAEGPEVTTMCRPALLVGVSPTSGPAGGGVVLALSCGGFGDLGLLPGGGSCRLGTTSPVAAQWVGPEGVRCVSPARAPGWHPVGATGSTPVHGIDRPPTFVTLPDALHRSSSRPSSAHRGSNLEPMPPAVSADGDVHGGVTVVTEGVDGDTARLACFFIGGGGRRLRADRGAGVGATVCDPVPPSGVGFTVLALALDGWVDARGGDDGTRGGAFGTANRAGVAAAGELAVLVSAAVAGVLPREVLAGSEPTVTVVGEHLRRHPGEQQLGVHTPVDPGGGAWGGQWCLFGEAPPTPVLAISSAVATCELPAPSAPRSRALAPPMARRRVELSPLPTHSADRSPRGPCAAAGGGCVAVKYWPAAASTMSVEPPSAPRGGGTAVVVHGRGFPDVVSLACRFGSTGPVAAQWGGSTRVTCLAPARAIGSAAVAVSGAWGVKGVAVRFRSAAEAHAALPPAGRRPGGPSLVVVGATGAPGERERATCRVGGGGEERASCAPTAEAEKRRSRSAPSHAASLSRLHACGGVDASGPVVATCLAPPSGGAAFDVLALGFAAETLGGGSGGDGEHAGGGGGGGGFHFGGRFSGFSGAAVEIEYAEDPLAVAAVPAAAPASGGVRVNVVGAHGAWSFGGGASGGHVGGGCAPDVASGVGGGGGGGRRGAWCAFGKTAVPAMVFSSVLAACEAPRVTSEGTSVLEATLAPLSGGDGESTMSQHGQQRVSFAHVAPVATLSVAPAAADWLASPVLTVTGRGFAANLEGLHCRVGVVGPIAARWVSGTEVHCVAPAHAGRRAAPVAALTSLSMAPAFSIGSIQSVGLPLVRFDVHAERLDPQGRPGGRREVTPGGWDDAEGIRTPDPEDDAKAALHAALPGSTSGGAPVVVAGRHLTTATGIGGGVASEKCWCVFGAYAAPAERVSTALVRCSEAPTALHANAAGSIRLACPRWGRSRHVAGEIAPRGGDADADEGGGRVPMTLLRRPRLEEVRPAMVPSRGGATVTFTGVGFHSGGDAGGVYACRFGSIGPIAAQHLSPHEVRCVAPAAAGGRWTRVGVTPNDGGEYEWGDGGEPRPAVYYDPLLLSSLDGGHGAGHGVGLPPGGPARGNTAFELFHVAGRLEFLGGGTNGPRCVFGDAAATTAGEYQHANDARRSVRSVACQTPSRRSTGGFEAVRVLADGVGFVDTSAQFAVHVDARVRTVFPRLSWGPEVVHVLGEHLAPGGTHGSSLSGGAAIEGGANDATPACVFGAVAAPAHVISSAVVACEVSAPVVMAPDRSREIEGGGDGTEGPWGEGDPFAAVAVASGETSGGLRPMTVCSQGGSSACDATDAGGALWFQSVAATVPVASDVAEGWTDGGTLVRVALSNPLPPEWLECRFGAVAVPARPALASSAEAYGSRAAHRAGGSNADMELECVTPGHGPGLVPVQVALAHSRVPSLGSVTFRFS